MTAYGVYHTHKRDMDQFKCDMDFVGVNVYQPFYDGSWGDKSPSDITDDQRTSMGWVIDGRVLYYTVKFFHKRYGLPVMVTENGMADNDIVRDGMVEDEKRIRFMKDYIGNLKRAVDEGIPVLGYQYWSLLDNFEWAEGYGPRFGLIHVDYSTQKRVLKDSAAFYSQIIASSGEVLT